MPRTLKTVGIALVAAAAATTAVVVASASDSNSTPSRDAIQRRVNHDMTRLARSGIYVTETALAAKCVVVDVANPTPPNRDYLNKRYGPGLCIERTGVARVACAEITIQPRTEKYVVPDLRDLGIYEAERRAVAAGFTYAIRCAGEGSRTPRRPSRLSPLVGARITAQCPEPGAEAPVNLPIALQAQAVLPGGFTYTSTAFVTSFKAPRCVDGWPE
jgi:hypothetical protein